MDLVLVLNLCKDLVEFETIVIHLGKERRHLMCKVPQFILLG
jgi:hypothetical protein